MKNLKVQNMDSRFHGDDGEGDVIFAFPSVILAKAGIHFCV